MRRLKKEEQEKVLKVDDVTLKETDYHVMKGWIEITYTNDNQDLFLQS